jgi:hypothetical protein
MEPPGFSRRQGMQGRWQRVWVQLIQDEELKLRMGAEAAEDARKI